MSPEKNITVEINFERPETIVALVEQLRAKDARSGVACLLEGCLSLMQGDYSHAVRQLVSFFQSNEVLATNLHLLFSIFAMAPNISVLKKILDNLRPYIIEALLSRDIMRETPALMDALRFSKSSPKEYQSLLGQHLIKQLINKAYDTDMLELALYLEHQYYSDYISRIETDAAFGQGMSAIKNAASQAGKRLSEQLKFSAPQYREKQVVGFFVHNANMMAHVSNIFQFLSACSKMDQLKFTPIIYCYSGRDEKFQNAFASINVPIVYLDVDGQDKEIIGVSNRLIYLKKSCSDHHVTRFVWVCLAIWMPFAFGLKLAEKQIWWSQKWQKLNLTEIDTYIFSFGLKPKTKLNGITWRNGWFQHQKWVPSPQPKKTDEIRQNFSGKVILGTLARADKITDKRYLYSVSAILEANPNSVFLWTGKIRLPEIDEFFKNQNVLSQTHFIGWVDTNIYANAFDILLDTFPIGNGTTATQAMEMGTPVVIHRSNDEFRTLDLLLGAMRSSEDTNNNRVAQMRRIFEFSSQGQDCLYTCAAHTDEYISLASKLIVDAEFRRQVGSAYKIFVKDFMSDPAESARIFASHLLA